MKKILSLAMAAILVFSLVACSGGSAKTLKGEAEGYGGPIKVEVTKDGDKITDIKVDAAKETPEVGGKAIEELTKAIKEKGTTEVELISSATVTSEAFLKAINEAK